MVKADRRLAEDYRELGVIPVPMQIPVRLEWADVARILPFAAEVLLAEVVAVAVQDILVEAEEEMVRVEAAAVMPILPQPVLSIRRDIKPVTDK